MTQLQRDINSVINNVKTLTTKLERIKTEIDHLDSAGISSRSTSRSLASKSGSAAAASATTRKPKKATAYDTALAVINRSKKGVTVSQLREKTGFNEKKVWNLLYKAKKQGKVKNPRRGVYIKA